jgi:hypothetical protein
MATRSTIALEFADGTVGQVYCHWDGYLSHNGKILQENYSNPFVLRDLIDLGDISSLRPTIGTKHPFSVFDLSADSPLSKDGKFEELYGDMTTFYGRDRSEHNVYARYFKDFADYRANGQAEEYDYILRSVNGKATWFVSDHGGDFKPLAVALIEEILETVEVLPL